MDRAFDFWRRNPSATVEVRVAPDGTIVGRKLVTPVRQRAARAARTSRPMRPSAPTTMTPALPEFLRPYQRRGVEWLHHLCDADCHGLLADEMGLGKTLQALALMNGDLRQITLWAVGALAVLGVFDTGGAAVFDDDALHLAVDVARRA